MLKSVIGWEVGITLVETKPGKVKASFRTRDQDRYDVSVIASRVGGGGHKAASGANLAMPLAEAKAAIIDAVSKSV
jgi:phosphoesterase RecJ-like protein